MTSSAIDKMSLGTRIERVENQNKRLKNYLAALSVCFASIVLMGAAANLSDGKFNELTAKVLTLVDDSGNKRVVIGHGNEEGTGINIFNSSGVKILGIGLPADEMGSGILFNDQEGRPRIGLGLDEGLPGMAIVDQGGKKIIALGGDARGYGLTILDDNEAERASIGYKEGDTGVALYNDQGEYVRGMVLQKDGYNYFSYTDANGKEVVMP